MSKVNNSDVQAKLKREALAKVAALANLDAMIATQSEINTQLVRELFSATRFS